VKSYKKIVESIPIAQKPGKENKPIKGKDAKDISRASPDSTTKGKKQLVNVTSSSSEYQCSLPGPILSGKSKKKTVSISSNVTVCSGNTREHVQLGDVDSTQSESGTQGKQKGKHTHHNVVEVKYDEPQCKQQ